ncbi:hypothetical protein FOA43_004741 [Brettanomyces nanus]|uniref:Uncharacterized protein n=1 Tax=Eeniella nana TaxID=13502 RepID=A0A875SCD8_EENNA|nr:uncharacterized protein FOA43_004741 [Brettanomyces nanus]QPG77332.1 hypothetical protein FOA43_004741 [Brettanomyces nanus]
MSGIRLLDLIKPFASIFLEVELPYEKSIFDEKLVYTVAAAIIYLLLGLPINGVNDENVVDAFGWLRNCFASTPGTLLEFGVLPVAFSAFLWQIAAGDKLLDVDFTSSSDRKLFQSLQKLTSILLGFVFAVLLVFAGYFQPIDYFTSAAENGELLVEPSLFSKLLIVVELTVSNTIITLMAELLDKHYGFGSGIIDFIVISSATTFTTSFIGLTTQVTSRGFESTGALVQFVKNMFSSKSYAYGIVEAFTRQNLTNLTQIYAAIFAVCLIVYLSNCRYEISIKSSKVRSMASIYPIKLLYCGAVPLIFTYSVLYFCNIIGFSLTRIFSSNKYLALIGTWELEPEFKKTYNLTGGLLYLISASPSCSSTNPLLSLVRPFTYTAFVVVVSTLFGKAWPHMSGSSAKDVAKQFKEQDITMVGRRDVLMSKEIGKIIVPASSAGSFATALAAAICECCGGSKGLSYGTVTGVLGSLSVLEEIVSEWQQTGAAGSSQLSQFIPTQ